MSVSEAKSNLARLLAAENIIVEQRKVKTAFFDTKTRLLVLPTFKEDLSADVTDLMISHECAHALYTPYEEWQSAIDEKKIKKSILNVVEDARIERKIKSKYPGLRQIYSRAYKELQNMNFFGIEGFLSSNFNLIDKINLHFKIGFIQDMNFNEEEEVFVKKVENLTTFEEVVLVSKEIQEYMKKHYVKPDFDNIEYFDNIELDLDYELEELEEDEESETENENLKQESDEDSSDEKPEDDQESESEEESKIEKSEETDSEGEKLEPEELEDEEFDIESNTDIASNEAMKELLSDAYKDSYYVDIPDFDLNYYIVNYQEFYKRVKADKLPVDNSKLKSFKSETTAIVSYLTKEFMLKKNANGRKKSKVSKTGDINLSKLFSYKISEDIFKRNITVPNAQSHGLVFFLDWSGSMNYYMTDTIKQLITMLLFCKKLNIPFEVYAFSTSYRDEKTIEFKESLYNVEQENEVLVYPLRLLNMFSSKMNITQFNTACSFLLTLAENFQCKYSYNYWGNGHLFQVPDWLCLGDTPLNHTILISPEIINSFQEQYKVQIVNSIYLTDGESHNLKIKKTENKFGPLSSNIERVYLRHKKYKVSKKFNPIKRCEAETNQCLSFIKEYCDFRILGFRLIEPKYFKQRLNQGHIISDENAVKRFNRENCFLDENTAYDKYYYIKTNTIGEEENLNIEDGDSVSSITKKFSKSFTNKLNNRIFLKKFIEFIS